MCEDGFAGDDAPYAVCPSIDDNPEMPGTMDQKDSNEGAEGAGSCVYACKAQASARVDVPTAPTTLKYTIEDADDGSGMCKAGFASDDAPHVRLTTSRGMQPRMIVFSVPGICSQMFFIIFGSRGSSGSHGSSSSVLESLLELTDATVMMNNDLTDTLHRIWQSFPRCLGAT